jgi:hypothetical protein
MHLEFQYVIGPENGTSPGTGRKTSEKRRCSSLLFCGLPRRIIEPDDGVFHADLWNERYN